MSVSELIKSVLPVAATQPDAATIATPTKANVILNTTSINSSATIRTKNQQTPTTNGLLGNVSSNEKVDNTTNTTNSTNNKGKPLPKTPEEFYKDLQQFHEKRGTPIAHFPKISGRTIDLHAIYNDVTERGGFHKVNNRDEWSEVLPIVGLRDKCVNACAAVKQIYRRFLEKYERLTFFGEDPDKMEALEASEAQESGRSRSSRYPSMHGFTASGVNSVPMTYNYRQHIVNMERRRTFRLSTDLYKHSSYEKLMLSLISPLPNEQDFAINICILMANENKNTFKLVEYPKILDVLLAHAGVYADYTLRKLFQHIYKGVRKHSLYDFWFDLLHEKPQILDLYTDEQALRDAMLIDEEDLQNNNEKSVVIKECLSMNFLNLGRERGRQEYVGQRIQQILNIVRNLSFFEENVPIFGKNRTLLRFLVMSSNVHWGNLHIQALDIFGNIATELDLYDPSSDELSRSLMATLCYGIEGTDRAVIINSLEILYKLCQKESNEDYINKCLNLKLYETLCLFLSLNDIMLLIFTLEAIYALTSMGTRSCQLLMQVRGVIDQLVSLISVEAQAYGPDGCILMRVVETVPGNMLPMVAQNMVNLQNAAVTQQQKLQTAALPVVTQTPTLVQPQIIQTQQTQYQSPQQPSSILQQQQQQQAQSSVVLTVPVLQSTQSIQQIVNKNLDTKTTQQQTQTVNQQVQNQSIATTLNNNNNISQQESQSSILQTSTQSTTIPTTAVAQTTPTLAPPPPPPPVPTSISTPLNRTTMFTASSNQFTHDDEQYGVAWLVATFERAAGIESRIEQQELYRMYLTHCQKAGKHSVVNHLQFPRLVRHVFGNNVGPAIVRRGDGTEYAGIHFVAIKLRAQPLPIQIRTTNPNPTLTTTSISTTVTNKTTDLKKFKKQPMLQTTEPQIKNDDEKHENLPSNLAATTNCLLVTTACSSNSTTTTATLNAKQIITSNIQITPSMQATCIQQTTAATQPTTSLIKSLLANKVSQRQQKQKDLTVANTMQTLTQTNVIATNQSQQQTPIKVTSNAISALVNNPLMQNTPVKVGQTTIKPLNPQLTLEKKHATKLLETSAPPPLAPLSGTNVVKDNSGRSVIIANQMLVEILDKKNTDPPIPNTIIKRKLDDSNLSLLTDNGGPTIKRLAYDANGSVIGVVSSSSSNNNSNMSSSNVIREECNQVAPSRNAANLYAEMAASILEDEDLEDIPTLLTHGTHNSQQTVTTPPLATTTPASTTPQFQQTMLTINEPTTAQQSILLPAKIQHGGVQRQLLFQAAPSTQQSQLKLTTTTGQPTAMATIKTEQGLQTVPVILQQKPLDQTQPQLMLQQQPTHTTQYVLATNQQGQTYIVAQQTQAPPPPPPQQPTQTVLVTQTPQQQSTGAKTIIILQQQTLPTNQCGTTVQQLTSGVGQKMLMTTAQGQSVLVTQRTAPSPATTPTPPPSSPIIINPGTSNVTGPLLQRQLLQTANNISTTASAPSTGQISPTLLSQLNHIPATIKLHQPSVISTMGGTSTTATITRVGKPLTITSAVASAATLQMPQLQQHSSIIQQHIISGPTEKRQVILTGSGRAIEIKETVIAQPSPTLASATPQSTLLNSQTIITHSPRPLLETNLQTQSQTNMLQQKISTTTNSNNTQKIVPTEIPCSVSTAVSIAKQQNAQATQVIVTQSPLGKKTTVITRPSTQTGILKTPTISGGPPPLAVHSSIQHTTTQTTESQQKSDEFAKTSPLSTPTATPPPQITTTSSTTNSTGSSSTTTTITSTSTQLNNFDMNWLYVCDWRNCPRRKFKSLNDLQQHACTVHTPEHLDPAAEIFCQWGPGPTLCDGIPRKRYSLMTHLIDRHITADALRQSLQRRLSNGTNNLQPTQPPVTIIRNMSDTQRGNSASPALSTSSSSGSMPTTGSSALQAIKRHTADFMNAKELQDENEGPVTKSIRLTAALILRNLVTYTNTAKRSIRRYEPHLSNIALSNVESSGTLSHILFELNN